MNMTTIPPSVISSWNRSRKYGINPQEAHHRSLSPRELLDRQAVMKELLDASRDILDHLYQQLKQTDIIIALTDQDGYLVATWGCPTIANQFRKGIFDVGTNWNEDTKGTTAIGLALTEKRPVTVLGKQHYCLEYHVLGCSATPLFSATGELLGILGIGGDVRTHYDHLLPLIVAAAQACQSRLLLQSTERELVLHLCESDTTMKSYKKPLISVDEEGLIKRINEEAAQILQMPMSECVGRPLSHWIGEKQMTNLLSAKNLSLKQMDVVNPPSANHPHRWIIQPILDQRPKVFRKLHSSDVKQPDNSTSFITRGVKIGKAVVQCPRVQKLYRFALRVAKTNANILICGETGTGKGVLAKEIHRASGRTGPFLTLNCGAIPSQLIESELFGYERGAFTGARSNGHQGKFEAADGGTLFLDEIGEMSPMAQVALLKVLEEKVITRIGSHRPIPVNVRIIAATNKDLVREVEEGRFREDLYYRLREIELALPPLRERTDLAYLIEEFMAQISEELKIGMTLELDAYHALLQYKWPGNIREMRQVIRQAAFHAYMGRESTTISVEDLSFSNQLKSPVSVSLHEMEEEVIARTLQATGGNLTAAARQLGIGRTTLYRKLSQYPKLKHLHKRLQQR